MKKIRVPTPFGCLLRQHRTQGGRLQKQLALDLGVSPSIVCGWESGAKAPPRGRQLEALIGVMRLGADDAGALRHVAAISQPTLRLAHGTPMAGYQVIHDLASLLPSMSNQHLAVLAGVLKLQVRQAA